MSRSRLSYFIRRSVPSTSSADILVVQKRCIATSQAPEAAEVDFANSPYYPSNVITIKKHVPPTSVEENVAYYTMKQTKYRALMSERKLSLEERYYRHPPIETEPLDTKGITLNIIKQVRTGEAKAAQIAQVEVEGIKNNSLVAKFYDPFYYDHEQDDVEPFLAVDYAYYKEISAYWYLKAYQGYLVPRYYGSFSCEFPLGTGSRAVRLIVIDYVKGTCMDTINPATLSQIARQNIMEKVVWIESYLYAKRFYHQDDYPRNIIIQSDPMHFENRDINVVFVDLESSKFGWEIKKPISDAAISPILRWHEQGKRNDPFKTAGWIDWEWQPWLERCFKDDPVFEPTTEAQEKAWIL